MNFREAHIFDFSWGNEYFYVNLRQKIDGYLHFHKNLSKKNAFPQKITNKKKKKKKKKYKPKIGSPIVKKNQKNKKNKEKKMNEKNRPFGLLAQTSNYIDLI